MLRWMVLAVLLVGIFPVRLLWAADATEGEIDFVPVWQEAQTVAAVEEKDVYLLQRSAKQCRRGQYDAALQDAEKAIAGDTSDAAAFFLGGKAYFGKMQQELDDSAAKTASAVAAIERLTRAIALEERRAEYYFVTSLVYRYKGGVSYAKSYFQAGMERLNDAIKKDQSGRLHLLRGIVFAIGEPQYTDKAAAQKNVIEDAKLALQWFDAAVEKTPRSAKLYCQRGMARLLLAQTEEARRDFTTASFLDPADESARFLTVCCWSLLGKTGEAARAFSALQQLAPDWITDGQHYTLKNVLRWYFLYGELDWNIKSEREG